MNARSVLVACCIPALAALSCERSTPSKAAERIDEPAEVTLDALETSPHGIYSLSREDHRRLEQVHATPGPYLDVIRRRYEPGTIAALANDRRRADRFMTTAHVLADAEDPQVVALLAAWWRELDAALSDAAKSTSVTVVGRMEAAVLGALDGRYDPTVVSRILDTLPRMDVRRRNDVLQYLRQSCRGNADVAARLRSLYEAAGSPLQGDIEVARTLSLVKGTP